MTDIVERRVEAQASEDLHPDHPLPRLSRQKGNPMTGYWYLASPYSNYPDGTEAAFKLACDNAALLLKAGINVYSPIAHSHPVAAAGGIDPLEHDIWLPADKPLMDAAVGLIELTALGWTESIGMDVEDNAFRAAGKPIVFMSPGVVPSDEEFSRAASRAPKAPACAESNSRLDRFDNAVSTVTKDRGAVYGHPSIDFDRAARLKAVVAECKNPLARHALEMACVKIARLIETPDHVDSWVDLAGYARTGIMVTD